MQRPVASVSWSPVMICAFPLYVCLQAQVHRPAVNESHAAAPSPADFPLYVCLQAQVHRPAVDGSHAAAPSPADFHCTRACRRRCTVQLSMEVTQQHHPQLISQLAVLSTQTMCIFCPTPPTSQQHWHMASIS